MVKVVSKDLPNEMVVFFRNVLGLLVLIPLIVRRGTDIFKPHLFHVHVMRVLSGLAAMYCAFYAIAHLHLADALVLTYTAPLFVPFIAKIWLKEDIPSGMLWILPLGFLGVVLIVKPGFGLFQMASVVGLLSGFLAGVALVGVRRLTLVDSISRIVFWFGFLATGLSAVPVIRVWKMPEMSLWGFLLLLGVFATAAQIFLTRAHRHAPAAQIGPFIYTAVLLAGVWDWLFWEKFPDMYSLLGAVLVCAAGVFTITRSGRKTAPMQEFVPAK